MALAVLALGASLFSSPVHGLAQAQTRKTILGVQGSGFTVNGQPRFLLGISYYAGLAVPIERLRGDLDAMRSSGFNWFRVWATWSAFGYDVSAVDGEGRPRDEFLKSLVTLLTEADLRGLVVDVTLSRGNGVTGPPRLQTLEAHMRAALAIADALAEQRNWYLDLGNERNIQDKRFVSFTDLKAIHDAVHKRLPHLLVTASHAGDLTRDDVRKYLEVVGIDFLAPHRPRGKDSASASEAKTKQALAWTRELGRVVPVHYQEPFRRGFGNYDPAANEYLTDLAESRAGGAAGWCLHNGDTRNANDGQPRRSFDLRGPAPLFDRLDASEREVVRQLNNQ